MRFNSVVGTPAFALKEIFKIIHYSSLFDFTRALRYYSNKSPCKNLHFFKFGKIGSCTLGYSVFSQLLKVEFALNGVGVARPELAPYGGPEARPPENLEFPVF